jgi:transcriptional regulator with XRE-family HTH domain
LSIEEYVNRAKHFNIACEVKLAEKIRGIKEVLSFNLKKNRLKLGLTQEKLSEKANISTHYFAMVELAKKFPSASMLERIAAALEIEPHELFYMPSAAENAINGLKVTVAADIERIVAEAVEKVLAAKFNEQYFVVNASSNRAVAHPQEARKK